MARLDEAVAAYREALQEFDEKRTPHYWKAAQGNLNQALILIAQRKAQATGSPGK